MTELLRHMYMKDGHNKIIYVYHKLYWMHVLCSPIRTSGCICDKIIGDHILQ